MSDKKRKDKDSGTYTEFYLVEAKYTQEESLDKLRSALGLFKGISPRFTARAQESDAFRVRTLYIPVYSLTADAEYIWKKSHGKKSALTTEHKEKRRIECTRFRAPKELSPDGFREDGAKKLSPSELPAALYADSEIPFKENAHVLKKTAADCAPVSSARYSLSGELFKVFFIPVLEAVCNDDGEEYTCFVNEYNGAVTAEYPVSERVQADVEKTLGRVRSAKQCIAFSALFVFVFAALALIKGFRQDSGVTPATVVVLFLLLLVPLFAFLKCLSYNREKLLRLAGDSGRTPWGVPAVLAAVLAWSSCAFSIVLFACNVL